MYVQRNTEERSRIIVAVESNKYCMCVCVRTRPRVRPYAMALGRVHVPTCSLAYLACNSNAPYCDVICAAFCSTKFFDIIS
jgi:hypothetical protein